MAKSIVVQIGCGECDRSRYARLLLRLFDTSKTVLLSRISIAGRLRGTRIAHGTHLGLRTFRCGCFKRKHMCMWSSFCAKLSRCGGDEHTENCIFILSALLAECRSLPIRALITDMSRYIVVACEPNEQHKNCRIGEKAKANEGKKMRVFDQHVTLTWATNKPIQAHSNPTKPTHPIC